MKDPGFTEDEVHSNVVKHSEAILSFDTCITWASENNVPS